MKLLLHKILFQHRWKFVHTAREFYNESDKLPTHIFEILECKECGKRINRRVG